MASLPRIGETISGFTVTELGTIHMLGARTVLFNHDSVLLPKVSQQGYLL